MVSYSGYTATLRSIVSNEANRKFSTIVEANGKYYQIKFCEVGHRHNINEFIAHYFCSLIGAPILDGAFLKLSDDQLKILNDRVGSISSFNKIDTTISKKNFFFGVEWKKDIYDLKKHEKLLPTINKSENKKEFYSIFPIDQMLKNYDRHLGNHLFIKNGKKTRYYIIDFDRIFGYTSWARMHALMNNFDCMRLPIPPGQFDELEFLHSIVTRETFEYAFAFAFAISSTVTYDAIDDMCNIILEIYDVSKEEVDTIRLWFVQRMKDFQKICLDNTECFPNVKQKRLTYVHR